MTQEQIIYWLETIKEKLIQDKYSSNSAHNEIEAINKAIKLVKNISIIVAKKSIPTDCGIPPHDREEIARKEIACELINHVKYSLIEFEMSDVTIGIYSTREETYTGMLGVVNPKILKN